jgi:hypothetical protein
VRAQVAQVLHRLVHSRDDARRDLDDRLQELGLDPFLLLAALEGEEDLVDPRDELIALAVEDLELLLDAETERRALTVVLIQLSPPEKAGG